jgi:hypothetical protein
VGPFFRFEDAMSNVVEWHELQPITEEAFRIWFTCPERRWAEQAWGHLTKAGLADAVGPLDRLRAQIRFLVLASLYRDWCKVVWDEEQEDSPEAWLSGGGCEINHLHVGQLLGPDVELSANDDLDEALTTLMQREHQRVVAALLEGFGGITGLFIALWRSNSHPEDENCDDEDGRKDPPDTDADILNDPTDEKLAGYIWIDQGCESYGLTRGLVDSDP